MFKKSTIATLTLGSLISAFAEPTTPAIPGFDPARAAFSFSGDMDLDGTAGGLDLQSFEIRALLSRPIEPLDGLILLPVFDYEATSLDFSDRPAGFPIGDEDLHSVYLSAFAFHSRDGSPWILGGWGRAELASDFQNIDGDDFTFDLAGGGGYRFSDKFMLGIGGAVVNLNGDVNFYPGIAFDWIVNERVRIGLYGPVFIAAYTPDENWELEFRGDSGGGLWNIRDTGGSSHSIDVASYRLGLFASRRLTEKTWLSAGVGATVGNVIRLTQPDGDKLFKQDMDSGLFGEINLRVTAW
jgi:Domain of unknown function (DUF6268)